MFSQINNEERQEHEVRSKEGRTKRREDKYGEEVKKDKNEGAIRCVLTNK
jgi:hypothetical protein